MTERTRQGCCVFCLLATIVLTAVFVRLMADPMLAMRNDAMQRELDRCHEQLATPDDMWPSWSIGKLFKPDGGKP